jgi:predicted HD phosphohydrolase
MGKDPEARRQYENEAWYDMACKFTDEWDQAAFDPAYDTLPFAHFEPMIERVFAAPRREKAQGA